MKKTKIHKLLYDGRIGVTFDPDKHTYLVSVAGSGREAKCPGVTSILSSIGKGDALLYWAINQALDLVRLRFSEYDSIDEVKLERILDEAKFAHRVAASSAALIGTITHSWIQSFIETKKQPAMPQNEEACNCIKAFLVWYEEYKPKVIVSERIVFSEVHHYSGMADLFFKLKGRILLLDFKTSSAIYPDMGYQLAAYASAIMEEKPEVKEIDRYILRLPKDGDPYEFQQFTDYARDKEAFLAALVIYRAGRK